MTYTQIKVRLKKYIFILCSLHFYETFLLRYCFSYVDLLC